MRVEPLTGYLHISVVLGTLQDIVGEDNSAILRVVVNRSMRMRYRWMLGPMTCVELVKHLLGIRCWALTPYQLYRYLHGLTRKTERI